MFSLGFCICHTRADPGTDHRQLQLGEYSGNLEKRLRHGIRLTGSAVHRDTANNDEPQPFVTDGVYDPAELFG